MRIAVLAVQGAFIEHEYMLEKLGASCIELRQKRDLEQDFQGIILPGGESTVQGKLLRELDMFDTLNDYISKDMPVFGTCAGLILLAEKLANDSNTYFASLPVVVERNAYGRQLGSFSYMGKLNGAGNEDKDFPLEFIRAPYIQSIGDGVKVLTEIDRKPKDKTGRNIVGVTYKNQIGVAFHPELTDDTRCHEMFLNLCK